MKKFIVLLFGIGVFTGLSAQKNVKPAKPKVIVTKPVMKNGLDSISYALGVSFADYYRQQGIKNLNTTMVACAINDILKEDKSSLNQDQVKNVITNYLQKLQMEKAANNKKTGQEFLAGNKEKSGIVALSSGLQYEIMKEGNGPKPTIKDKVSCHYHGTLIDGTVFDSSVERGQPAQFPVGGVIKGWVEALQLMPVGSKWKLFIPSELAYGDNQAGPKIQPGSTLIFEVELLDIVK